MKTLIKNAKIVTRSEIIENGVCLIEDGNIIQVGANFSNVEVDKVIDANGGYLIPGFIDLHCHGGNGLDFMDATPQEIEEISKFHLSHGTTTLYATTMTDSWDNIESSLRNYAEVLSADKQITLNGVHLEGPWFSPAQCGAQDPENMDFPSKERLDYLLEYYPFIKRISVAPEIENGIMIGNYGAKKGLVMSVGHTDADFDTVVTASENGYTLLTHFYSGMAGVVRKNAFRVAGAVEAGYYLDDMNVEVIADGKHLPQSLLKLIYKIKGSDNICLITDGTRGSGCANGTTFMLGRKIGGVKSIIEDDVAKLPDRTAFAGSVATMDRVYRTMGEAIGKNLVELSKMASTTPAKVMGLTDRGEIAVGKRADLIVLDKNLNIEKVMLKGETI